MDFRAEIEQAKHELEMARAEHARAVRRVAEAAQTLGILTGVYHGLSALDDRPPAAIDDARRVQSNGDGRKRAPKGEARRRVDALLNDVWPSGLAKDEILQRATEEGKPIPAGTLRHALTQLERNRRAELRDGLWFAMRTDATAHREAAGAGQSYPAASFTRAQEDSHEAAITEPVV